MHLRLIRPAICGILLPGLWLAGAAEQKTVRATIRPPQERKPAPAFQLRNGDGKAVRNEDYRGRVLLLDFWATECGGCRLEIPWFVAVEKAYGNRNFTVVGISMDIAYENLAGADEAWNRVNPFVRSQGVNYPILMGDEGVTKSFGIEAMPETYLIDRRGRVAATWVGIVDRNNLEANIRALLTE